MIIGDHHAIFHDWEFLEDGRTIEPISVGMVKKNLRDREIVDELYRVFRLSPMQQERVYGNEWLRANVLPRLPQVPNPTPRDWLDYSAPEVASTEQIRAEVERFAIVPGPLELWGWYGAYDHVCLAQLFGRMMDLPPHIPMWTNDLRTLHSECGFPELPKGLQQGSHNALEDAREMVDVDRWLRDWAYGHEVRL